MQPGGQGSKVTGGRGRIARVSVELRERRWRDAVSAADLGLDGDDFYDSEKRNDEF